jgi:hypothetical protein
VIQHLLIAITELLQTELDGQLPTASPHFATLPVTDPKATQFPLVAIYPGNWTISLNNREDRLNVRTFQQIFWLDIYDQTFATSEQWASLITGILIARHDALIAQYNSATTSQTKAEYQSQHWITTHRLTEYRPLEGTCLYPKTGMGLQLQFTASGQITVTPKVPESDRVIQTVTITGSAADQPLPITQIGSNS